MGRVIARILAMAEKEVVHILRDRQFLVFALGMPVVLILLFGYAVSFDIEHVPLAVVDQDRTPASRRLVKAFTASDVFEVAAERTDPEEAESLFRSGAGDRALDLIDRAVSYGRGNLGWIEHDPDFDSLRGDPRFEAIVNRLRVTSGAPT